MKEFDKCYFCESYDDVREHSCINPCCFYHSGYQIDVNKVLKKAEELKISVTDVLNLIKACNL